MATVTKRLRYEILRRDNHACRYCGAKAPEVKLVVDAVTPEALGGSHKDPANLVTACEPCNSGKTSTSPDAPLVADVAQDALRWSQAIAVAAAEMLARTTELSEAQRQFAAAWSDWTCGAAKTPVPKPPDWRNSVDRFQAAGLPTPVLLECIQIAMARDRVKVADKFRYMCGIAWEKVTELQKRARQIIGGESADDEDDLPPEIIAGRAHLARELLEGMLDEDRDRLLAEAHEDWWQAETDDELAAAAALIAWSEASSDRTILAWHGTDLLERLPDGVGEEAMRRARTELYEQNGAAFSREDFASRAMHRAEQIYAVRAATAYLAGIPDEAEREEWITYAKALNSDRGERYEGFWIVAAANCARVIKDVGNYYPAMCRARGEHIPDCPRRAGYVVWFDELRCCNPPAEDAACDGHKHCEYHLEQLVDGSYVTRTGRRLIVRDYQAIESEPETVPF